MFQIDEPAQLSDSSNETLSLLCLRCGTQFRKVNLDMKNSNPRTFTVGISAIAGRLAEVLALVLLQLPKPFVKGKVEKGELS